MADNIDIRDAGSETKTMRTTDSAGVHTPHHNANLRVADAAVSGSNPVPVTPWKGMQIFPTIGNGALALIGINEQVDSGKIGNEVEAAFGEPRSGEITSVVFYSYEDGTGAVQVPTGTLTVFDGDPATAANDTNYSTGARGKVLGQVDVVSALWKADANGASVQVPCSIPFPALNSLWFAFRNNGAAINDAAGDDERISFRFLYRRDS